MALIRFFILFLRTSFGSFHHPYATYRQLGVGKGNLGPTVYLVLFSILYFLLASTLRTGIRNPFLLTIRFHELIVGGAAGFVGMLALLYWCGRVLGGKGSFRMLTLLWMYTLLPTLTWFYATSLFFYFLPPPRSASSLGIVFSLLYIAFSVAILMWKLILAYLTLRFGLKLDLRKIGTTAAVVTPFVGVYAITMYKLGVFRIPFL